MISFWSKVDKHGPIHPMLKTRCWIWTGAKSGEGYGQLDVDGRLRKATHIALELAGIQRNGLPALHHCDNPPCVRPDHLFCGTAGDNSRDMAAKGRAFGSRKTHCPRGHEYTLENTKRWNRKRRCVKCCQARYRLKRLKRSVAKTATKPLRSLRGGKR